MPGGGLQAFRKEVPAKFLQAHSMNIAALEIDKLWASPAHSTELDSC